MHQLIFLILVFEIVTVHLYYANAVFIDRVTDGDWDGVLFYISVKRETIQNELDNYHSSVSNECSDGPLLFVPEDSVLPDMHNNDRHPVYIDFGFMRSHDFDDYLADNPNPSVSTSGLEVTVTIPLLAGSPDGPPVYALALAKFYEKSRGDIPKINVIYPYIPVDEITLNDCGAFIRNGSDEMRVSFNRLRHSCKPPTSIVKEEFAEFALSDAQFGLPTPDYSFCDHHSFESQFCTNAKGVKCSVHRYAPNICQMWRSNNVKPCTTTVKIENIIENMDYREHGSGIRDFFLLGDDPINILASESGHFNFTMSLKYPCQEVY